MTWDYYEEGKEFTIKKEEKVKNIDGDQVSTRNKVVKKKKYQLQIHKKNFPRQF